MSKSAKKAASKTSVFSQVYRSSPVARLIPNKGAIFLSYNSADKSIANQVAAKLTAAGYRIANGEDVVEPGENWLSAVGRALDHSDAVVFFLSRAALRSIAIPHELEFVLSTKKFKDRVVPVLLDADLQVPWIVRRLPFIAMEKNASAEVDRVAKAVVKQLDQRV